MSLVARTFVTALLLAALSAARAADAGDAVVIDEAGVMRWSADQRELALFGANYCLPSSSDYRAAGYVGADRRKLIEQDMTHFARMGWDGLRLALWGDWENSDRAGNLIANEHLDLLDYLIFCAKQRGISMLFTPIHRHSALWPDGKDSDAIQGFSKFYPPAELGRNPAAIAAQQNYLRQILAHVNPYTGTALKDEPAIVFVELINEPEHRAGDFAGSVSYINALADAVRSTGCRKPLFFNLSQDFRMAPAIAASHVQGFSFGWYPTALVAGHTLQGNYLRWVDDYTPLLSPDIPRVPRIVYEFDSADLVAGYMYPAMARAFRQVGAQFAAMFAYDMLATAPYNLGWQTHYLNLVYSPRKAVSAIIAAEVMRTLPRGGHYGDYPANRRFGPFRVSYDEDLSEMVTPEKFIHAGDTATVPPQPATLRQVIGTGSSPIVAYEGLGSYFLDRLTDGVWRLEVYPDALFVQDPFAQRLNRETVCARLVWHAWPMHLNLPDLGDAFSIRPLNAGNSHRPRVKAGGFAIRPGVYLLTRDGAPTGPLPARVGALGLDEFVCPPDPGLPLQVIPRFPAEGIAGRSLTVSADVVTPDAPSAVRLQVRVGSAPSTAIPMVRTQGYRFSATLPAPMVRPGTMRFSMTVTTAARTVSFPAKGAPPWATQVLDARQPLVLFDAARDSRGIFALRSPGAFPEARPAQAGGPACLRFTFPAAGASPPRAFSVPVKSLVTARGASLSPARSLRVNARGAGRQLRVALVEDDGTTWAGSIALAPAWQEAVLLLSDLKPAVGLKLPQGYPGNWNRSLPPAAARGGPDDRLRLERVEQLQLSIDPSPAPGGESVDIASAKLSFE